MKTGSILKSKSGTLTNQLFVMLMNESLTEASYVILFDNLENNIIGDSTRGISINNLYESSIREMSEFIINNNI